MLVLTRLYFLGVNHDFSGLGEIILESVILTSFAVESLIAYTYVAQKHGCENNCLGPFRQQFIVAAVIILVVFSLIQVSYNIDIHHYQ